MSLNTRGQQIFEVVDGNSILRPAKIGIGVTTYNRPHSLDRWIDKLAEVTDLRGVKMIIADDSDDRKGVAFRKNQCLRHLKDCDYVFLFDDDCYPIKKGWVDIFINSKEEHLMYLDPKFHRLKDNYLNVDVYYDCGGVMLFMKKSAIERDFCFLNFLKA